MTNTTLELVGLRSAGEDAALQQAPIVPTFEAVQSLAQAAFDSGKVAVVEVWNPENTFRADHAKTVGTLLMPTVTDSTTGATFWCNTGNFTVKPQEGRPGDRGAFGENDGLVPRAITYGVGRKPHGETYLLRFLGFADI